MAAFSGDRGAPARTPSRTDADRGRSRRCSAAYAHADRLLRRSATRALARARRPHAALALALTDTFGRVAVETFAELADRYDVWLEAGVNMARDWRSSAAADDLRAARRRRAVREADPGGRALGDPAEPARDYAYEATTAEPVNMALLFDPDGKLVSKQVKAYLTPIELPGQLDLVPGDPRGPDRGRHAGRQARLRHLQGRLDAGRHRAASTTPGVEILVQPEFFVGDTVSTDGPVGARHAQGVRLLRPAAPPVAAGDGAARADRRRLRLLRRRAVAHRRAPAPRRPARRARRPGPGARLRAGAAVAGPGPGRPPDADGAAARRSWPRTRRRPRACSARTSQVGVDARRGGRPSAARTSRRAVQDAAAQRRPRPHGPHGRRRLGGGGPHPHGASRARRRWSRPRTRGAGHAPVAERRAGWPSRAPTARSSPPRARAGRSRLAPGRRRRRSASASRRSRSGGAYAAWLDDRDERHPRLRRRASASGPSGSTRTGPSSSPSSSTTLGAERRRARQAGARHLGRLRQLQVGRLRAAVRATAATSFAPQVRVNDSAGRPTRRSTTRRAPPSCAATRSWPGRTSASAPTLAPSPLYDIFGARAGRGQPAARRRRRTASAVRSPRPLARLPGGRPRGRLAVAPGADRRHPASREVGGAARRVDDAGARDVNCWRPAVVRLTRPEGAGGLGGRPRRSDEHLRAHAGATVRHVALMPDDDTPRSTERVTGMTALAIGAVLVLVLLNGFFVAAEFALVRVRRSRVEELAEAGAPRARLTLTLLDDMSRYLAACQVGITLTSLGIGFLGEPAIGHLFEEAFGEDAPGWLSTGVSFALAYLITTSLHITIGEQIPKIYSIEKADSVALRIARPLWLFTQGLPAVHRGPQRRLEPRAAGARHQHGRRVRGGRLARRAQGDHRPVDDRRAPGPGRGGDALRRLPPARAAGAPGDDAGARARDGRRLRGRRDRAAPLRVLRPHAADRHRGQQPATASSASCTPTSSPRC